MRYPLGDGQALEVTSVSFTGLSPGGVALYTGQAWLMGYTITAAAAATAAVVTLTDGNDTNGDPFALLRIPADSTLVVSRGVPGLPLEMGLVISSTVPITGSIIVGRHL